MLPGQWFLKGGPGFCRKVFADNLGCQVDEIENSGYIITSAGIAACENQLASQDAVQVCRESGIDLSQHQSRQLTPEMVNQNDIIMTMSRHHRDSIIRLFPAVADKCFVLNGDSDIADPIGMGIEHYRACFQQICTGIIEKKKEIL